MMYFSMRNRGFKRGTEERGKNGNGAEAKGRIITRSSLACDSYGKEVIEKFPSIKLCKGPGPLSDWNITPKYHLLCDYVFMSGGYCERMLLVVKQWNKYHNKYIVQISRVECQNKQFIHRKLLSTLTGLICFTLFVHKYILIYIGHEIYNLFVD